MTDVRAGGYSKQQIQNYRTNDAEEQIIWDSLSSSDGYNYVVYDVFLNETKRESPEPYPNKLILQNGTLIAGSTPNTIFGWTSKTYTDVQTDDIEEILAYLKYSTEGSGIIRFKISVDNGVNFLTILDTGLAIDLRAQEVAVVNIGNDVIIKLEILTDGSGNGATLNYFSLIF